MGWMDVEKDLVLERLGCIGIQPESVFKTSGGQFAIKVNLFNKGFFKISQSYLMDWMGCTSSIIWKFSFREPPYVVIVLGWRLRYATI